MSNRRLPVSSRPDAVLFPRDISQWTPEHRAALWGGDVGGMLRGLVRDAAADASFVARLATQTPTKPISTEAVALEKAGLNAG